MLSDILKLLFFGKIVNIVEKRWKDPIFRAEISRCMYNTATHCMQT